MPILLLTLMFIWTTNTTEVRICMKCLTRLFCAIIICMNIAIMEGAARLLMELMSFVDEPIRNQETSKNEWL